MNKMKVLAVLPYKELAEMVKRLSETYRQIEVECYVGNLKEGLDLAREKRSKENYDLILSRGGTADLIRQNMKDISVVEIPISFEDIFCAVMLGKNYKERFAIVSFSALTVQAHMLCELLQYDIEIRSIHSEEEAVLQLENLQDQGYTMIIGDVITAQKARELGLNVVLITSSPNSVRETLDQICCFMPLHKKKYRHKEYTDAVRRSCPYMLAILNDEKQIVYSSFQGKDMEESCFEQYFVKRYDSLMRAAGKPRVVEIGGNLYQVKVSLEKVDQEQYLFIYGHQIYQRDGEQSGIFMALELENRDYSFRSSFGVTNSIGNTKEEILMCSKTDLPVLILGEAGTGKDAAAKSIHLKNKNHDRPYVVIDCQLTSEKEWMKFFHKDSSPLLHINTTIYFKNIHYLTNNSMKLLKDQIENANILKRNKVIFSEVTVPNESISLFAKYILEQIPCVLLHPLPIRERKDDFKSILVLYMNEMNLEYGKHIVGFTDEAEELFLNYPWPGNITQVKRVLRELIISEDGVYITKENVQRYLKNETLHQSGIQKYNINLDQSLEDIIYDVVRITMNQENMNQSKVAQRLGIGRSTIWRILKKKEK